MGTFIHSGYTVLDVDGVVEDVAVRESWWWPAQRDGVWSAAQSFDIRRWTRNCVTIDT